MGVQSLASIGSKNFYLIVANVKIYDFALYFNPGQAQRSKLSGQVAGKQRAQLLARPHLYRSLRSSDDVDMTLLVRAHPWPLSQACGVLREPSIVLCISCGDQNAHYTLVTYH